MKKLTILILTLFGIPLCLAFLHSCNQRTKITTKDSTEFIQTVPIKSEKIMDEVKVGLNKVELDSNTILIYRADPATDGTESISIIQLK